MTLFRNNNINEIVVFVENQQVLLSWLFDSVEQPIPIKPANRRKTEQVSSRETTEDEMEINSDAQSSSQALTGGIGSDDDKGKMMEEVMKTYIKQQERLHTILQKKQHLQMVWGELDFIFVCHPNGVFPFFFLYWFPY